MKKILSLAVILAAPAASWAVSVTVNQSGSGNFTSIQAALDSGATNIVITDSAHYMENVRIGEQDTGGPAVTLTSTKRGPARPVITPTQNVNYTDSTRGNQAAGFAVFANDSQVSYLVIEAQPDLPAGAMFVMADRVMIESCVFQIAANTTATLGSSNPLLFFGQQGDGSGVLTPGVNPTPGGRDSNGCIVRNSEFNGVAPGRVAEPTGNGFDEGGLQNGSLGYLGPVSDGTGTSQCSGYVRMDHQTDGSDVTVTFDGCYFHHCRDYGIFPTNRKNGNGNVAVVVRNSRFDAQAKFQIRGRGANIVVENSVFSRSNQQRNGDGENSAVALQINDQHNPTGSVKNCVFFNCGSANAQKAYYGGVNNNNASNLTVENCTFVDCLNGVDTGSGGAAANLTVKNSLFHRIGLNLPPTMAAGNTVLTNGSPDLTNGLYAAWLFGLPNFGTDKWSGVFNRFRANDSIMTIQDCMVGLVDNEDLRTWDEALLANEVLGSRLLCGPDSSFAGLNTIVRATPVFANEDINAPNAFKLAASSPGQGKGADVSSGLGIKLVMNPNGSSATISWTPPIWVTGYSLKGTSTLENSTWTSVPGVVDNSATVSISSGTQYYALIKN